MQAAGNSPDRTRSGGGRSMPSSREDIELVARIDGHNGTLLEALAIERTLGLPAGSLEGTDLFEVVCGTSVPSLVSTIGVLLDQPDTTRALRLELCWPGCERAGVAVLAHSEDREVASPVITLTRSLDPVAWVRPDRDPIGDRDMFKSALAVALARGEQPRVVAVKIDDLDTIEVAYGDHAFGQLIEQVAGRVARNVESLRAHALLGASTMAFLVVEDPASVSDPLSVGSAVRDLLSLPVTLDDTDVFLFPRVAVGAHLGDQPETALRAVLRAVERLSGPSVLQVVGELDRDASVREFRLRNDLRFAIERDELRVFFQPIVDARHGRIAGAEALVRWEHPELGRLAPSQFVELAEETDFIDAVGAWVLRSVAARAGDWLRRGLVSERFVASVNVSPQQLLHRAILDTVTDALAVAGLPAAMLGCEVTESALLGREPSVDAVLRALVELDVVLAIDDFGTGHATLDYLQRVPAGTVKIDRQFIAPLPGDLRGVELVRGIVDLAHAVGKRVVAEGVETASQAELLRALGCDFVQGYLVSRPLDVPHFEALLAATRDVPLLELPDRARGDRDVTSMVIVDAELAIVGAIRGALAGAAVDIVGTATTIEEALAVVGATQPDVILTERHLSDGDTSEEIHRFRSAAPDASILIFASRPDERSLSQALAAGAKGYLDKHSSFDELITAISGVARGEIYVASRLVPLLTRRSADIDWPTLSDRELDVLAMLARGASTAEIAAELILSVNTVRNHIARLLRKLGARTRLEAVAIAAERNIVQR